MPSKGPCTRQMGQDGSFTSKYTDDMVASFNMKEEQVECLKQIVSTHLLVERLPVFL